MYDDRDKGTHIRAQYIGDYSIFGDFVSENNPTDTQNDGTLTLIHQLYRGRNTAGGVQFRFLPLIDEIGVLIVSGAGATTAWYKEVAYEQVKQFVSLGDGASNSYDQGFRIKGPQYYSRKVIINGTEQPQKGKPPKFLFKSPPGGVSLNKMIVSMELPHNSETFDPLDWDTADMGHTIKFRLKMCSASEWRNMMYNYNGTPEMETATAVPPQSNYGFVDEDFGIDIIETATISFKESYFIGDPLRYADAFDCNNDINAFWCRPEDPGGDWSGAQLEDWLGQGIYHITSNPTKYSAYNWGFKQQQSFDSQLCDPDAPDSQVSQLTIMNGVSERNEERQLRIRNDQDEGTGNYHYERPFVQNSEIRFDEDTGYYNIPEGYVVFLDFLEFEIEDPPERSCDDVVFPGFDGLWSSGVAYNDVLVDNSDGATSYEVGGIDYLKKLEAARGIYGCTDLNIILRIFRNQESEYVDAISSARVGGTNPNFRAYATVLEEEEIDTISEISAITVRSFVMGPQVVEEIETPANVVALVNNGDLFNKPEKFPDALNDFISPNINVFNTRGYSIVSCYGWDGGRRLQSERKNILYDFDNRTGIARPFYSYGWDGYNYGSRFIPYDQYYTPDLLKNYDGNNAYGLIGTEYFFSANDHRPLAGRDDFPAYLTFNLFSSMDWRCRPIKGAQYTFSCKLKVRRNYAEEAGYPNYPYTAPRFTQEYGFSSWNNFDDVEGTNAIRGNMQVAGLYSPLYMKCNPRDEDANLFFTMVHVRYDQDGTRPRWLEKQTIQLPRRNVWTTVSMVVNIENNDSMLILPFNGEERFMTDIMATDAQVELGPIASDFQLESGALFYEGPTSMGSFYAQTDFGKAALLGPSAPVWFMSDFSGNNRIPNDCMGIANEFGLYLEGNDALDNQNIAPADFFVPEFKTDAFGTPQSVCFGPLTTENTKPGGGGVPATCQNSDYGDKLVCPKDEDKETPDLDKVEGICLDRNKEVGQYIEPQSNSQITINPESIDGNPYNLEFTEPPPTRYENPIVTKQVPYTSAADGYTAIAGEQVTSGKTDPHTDPKQVTASRCADSRDYKTDQRYFNLAPASIRSPKNYTKRVNQQEILRGADSDVELITDVGGPFGVRQFRQGSPDDFDLGNNDICLLFGVDNRELVKEAGSKQGQVETENNCLTDGCTNTGTTKRAGQRCYGNRPKLPEPQITEDGTVVDPCRDKKPADPNDCEVNKEKFESYISWLEDSEYESNEFFNDGSSSGMPKFVGFASGGVGNVQANYENIKSLGYDVENILARAAGYTDAEIESGDVNFAEVYTGEGLDDDTDDF